MSDLRLKIGRAICEGEYGGYCVCAPNFTAHCTRNGGSIGRQVDAVMAVLRDAAILPSPPAPEGDR